MKKMKYCEYAPCTLQLCAIFSLRSSGGTRTLYLGIMSQVLCYCATTTDLLNFTTFMANIEMYWTSQFISYEENEVLWIRTLYFTIMCHFLSPFKRRDSNPVPWDNESSVMSLRYHRWLTVLYNFFSNIEMYWTSHVVLGLIVPDPVINKPNNLLIT